MRTANLISIIEAAEEVARVNSAIVAHAQVNGRKNNRLLLLHLKDGETIILDLRPLIATPVAGEDSSDVDLIRSHELAETVARANPETVELVQVDSRRRENEGCRAQLLVHLFKDRSIIVLDLLDFLAMPSNNLLDGKTVLSC